MIVKLEEKALILPRLYRDCVRFVEEISLIEEDYLWENVDVYVDDPNLMEEFLVIHSPSFCWGGKSLSAYITAKNESTIRKFAEILKKRQDFRMHVQTSIEIEPYVKRSVSWLDKAYVVRYFRADSATFKSHCAHRENAVKLTAENVKRSQPSASAHFVKRLETAPVYGYVNDEGRLVAMSGVGFLTRKSFAISYTETEPEYRGRGIAKCLTSLASETLIDRGLVGVYSTDVTNEASAKVAEALGFLPYIDLKCFYK